MEIVGDSNYHVHTCLRTLDWKKHPNQTVNVLTWQYHNNYLLDSPKWSGGILLNDFYVFLSLDVSLGWLGDDVASAVPLLEEAALLGYSCVSKTAAASSRVFVCQDFGGPLWTGLSPMNGRRTQLALLLRSTPLPKWHPACLLDNIFCRSYCGSKQGNKKTNHWR